jgi:hypothetical protein
LQLLTKVVEKIPLRVLMVTIVKNIPSTAFMLTGLLVGLLPEDPARLVVEGAPITPQGKGICT